MSLSPSHPVEVDLPEKGMTRPLFRSTTLSVTITVATLMFLLLFTAYRAWKADDRRPRRELASRASSVSSVDVN